MTLLSALTLRADGSFALDDNLIDKELEREERNSNALIKGTSITAFVRHDLFRVIGRLERLASDSVLCKSPLIWHYINDLKRIHNKLRDADERLCEGLELPYKRFNSGSEFLDTPQLALGAPIPNYDDYELTSEIMKSEQIWEEVGA